MGYAYFHFVGKDYSLVTIGMIAFTAVAQFGPAMIGGIFWKDGTRAGALCGLLAGFLIWGYTLVLPSLVQAGFLPSSFMTDGPFGITLLKPYQLFGLDTETLGLDLYAHAVFWSMLFNVGAYVGVSLFSRQTAVEHTQAALFVDVFKYSEDTEKSPFWRGTASLPDLRSLLGRFLGQQRADETLAGYAKRHNLNWEKGFTADAGLVSHAEKSLAGVIGSASARVMVASVVKEEPLGIEEVMNILDETRQVIIYSRELEKATADLKAANERLKELDRMKNEFISTVTHELRTPLTSVRALAEILHDNPDLDPLKHTQFTRIIITESERLTRLINDVLDFQKIESGRIEWQISRLDLKEIIKESVACTNQLILEKHIQLELNLPPQPAPITGDRDRLIQVMVNLLSNAVKFCDSEKGRISIGLTLETDYLKVMVSDNGIGISPEDQRQIFKEFRQAKDALRGRPRGTGLGLAITRRIIDFHRGQIWVDSQVGSGSTFSFTLPLAEVST
jgi:signal transduction histidine kinase